MTISNLRPSACCAAFVLASACAASIAQSASASGDPAARPPRIDANAPGCRPQRPASVPADVEGETTIWYQLSAAGRVNSAEIHHSAGPTREHRLLDNAARNALMRCPFAPALDASGRPVGGIVIVTWSWRLDQVVNASETAPSGAQDAR